MAEAPRSSTNGFGGAHGSASRFTVWDVALLNENPQRRMARRLRRLIIPEIRPSLPEPRSVRRALLQNYMRLLVLPASSTLPLLLRMAMRRPCLHLPVPSQSEHFTGRTFLHSATDGPGQPRHRGHPVAAVSPSSGASLLRLIIAVALASITAIHAGARLCPYPAMPSTP